MASHRANSRHLAGPHGGPSGTDRLTRRLLLRSGDTPFRLRLIFGSIPRTLRCAKPPRQANTPGQRITRPGYGNARKLAGLRCSLVMRWPPDVCLASGRAGQLVPAPPPPQPARPEARRSRPRAPRRKTMLDMYPSGVRAASFCSAYASPASEAGPPQNWPHSLPPPSPAPPLAVRVPRWA